MKRLASLLSVFDAQRALLSLHQDMWSSLFEHWKSLDGRRAQIVVAQDRLALRPWTGPNVFLGYEMIASREGAHVVVVETIAGGLCSTFVKVIAVGIVCILPFVTAGALLRGDGWLTVLAITGLGPLGLMTLYALTSIAFWQSRLLHGSFRRDLIAEFGDIKGGRRGGR